MLCAYTYSLTPTNLQVYSYSKMLSFADKLFGLQKILKSYSGHMCVVSVSLFVKYYHVSSNIHGCQLSYLAAAIV